MTARNKKPSGLSEEQQAFVSALGGREQSFALEATGEGYRLELMETLASGETRTRGVIRGYKTSVASLGVNGWNPNVTTEIEQEAIGESLISFGQIAPIVVTVHPERDGFKIIDGEHRFNELSEDVAVNVLFGYSPAEQKKLTIVLNETTGSADPFALATLVASIAPDLGGDIGVALPYSEDAIDGMIQSAKDATKIFDPGDGGGDGNGDGTGGIPMIHDKGKPYESTYAIVVSCDSEEHQEKVFDAISAQGYECKPISV